MTTIGNLLDVLQSLGFTEYEARAYSTLVQHDDLNGYELAKASRIPRANIYAVLDKLVQRGAAHRMDCTNGPRYSALDPKQLLRSIETGHQRTLDEARDAFASLAQRRESAAVFNLRDDELLPKARQLIDAADTSLLVAIQPTEAQVLAAPLQHARERGVAITTLCLEGCDHECSDCQGDIHRYPLAPAGELRWLLLVADARTAYVGHLGNTSVAALLTEQPLVVELASAYIRQSVTLALLGSELSGKFEGLLSREAQQCLRRLDTTGDIFGATQHPGKATPTS